MGSPRAAARLLPRLFLDGLVAMTEGLSSDARRRRAAFADSVGLRGFDLYHFADRGWPGHLAAFALQVADVRLDRSSVAMESGSKVMPSSATTLHTSRIAVASSFALISPKPRKSASRVGLWGTPNQRSNSSAPFSHRRSRPDERDRR
jgi:hypothetical protein